MKPKLLAAFLVTAACLGLQVSAHPPPTSKGRFQVEEVNATPEQISKTGGVIALLIGINNFQDKTFRSLKFAEKDASDIAAFLESSGVKKENIKLLTGSQATFTKVQEAFEWLIETANKEPGSAVFFFFSGHGERTAKGHTLVLYDSRAKALYKTGFVWEKEEKELRRISNKQVIVIDACYAAASTGSIGTKSNFLPSEYLQRFKAQGRVSFFSSEGLQTSEEHPQTKNGVFTHFFLKGLGRKDPSADENADQDKDECITAAELAAYVETKVKQFTGGRQTPQFEAKTNHGSANAFLLYKFPRCGTIRQKGFLLISTTLPQTQVQITHKKKKTHELREIKNQKSRLALDPGEYEIHLTKSGYQDVRIEVQIVAGWTHPFGVTLVPVERSDVVGLLGTAIQSGATGTSSSPLSSQPPTPNPSAPVQPTPTAQPTSAAPSQTTPVLLPAAPLQPQPSVKPELPTGWQQLKEAFGACHPSAECKPEEAQKAARLFREARGGLLPPVPAWISMAWEVASLAKAKALAEPFSRYQEADQAYEAWKKQQGFRGSNLRYYTRLQSHRVFGKLLWFAAQHASTSTEKQRLLGILWQEWRFSPFARDAYHLWMQALGSYGYSIVTDAEIAKAAHALLLPTYRQAKIAVRFFRYLKDRSGWRQKAQWGLIDAYKSLRAWSNLKTEAQELLSSLVLPRRKGRAYRKVLRNRQWLVPTIAEALLHTEGLEAAKTFVASSGPLPPKEQYRYFGAIAAWQREKGQLAEAIQTTHALLDLQHASPSQTRHLRHVLAAQMLAHGQAAKAQNLWSSLAQDFSLSAEDKLPFYFWAGVAASKASSSGDPYFREICTSYPFSIYGFLSCLRLQRSPSLTPTPLDADPFLSNPTAVALHSQLQERELFSFFAWKEIHQGSAPSPALVIASARAFANAGDWEMALQVLLQHQIEPLYQGRLPAEILRIAFPKPPAVQSSLHTAAHETSLEAEALLAIVRRESGFSYPTFGLRVGLMGLDPLWTNDTPSDHLANLRLGAKRLSSLQQNLSSLPLTFAAYRGPEDFLQTAFSSNAFAKDQPLLWLEFFDPILREYTLHPSNGTLWYYLFYRWLSSPSSVPSLSWLP